MSIGSHSATVSLYSSHPQIFVPASTRRVSDGVSGAAHGRLVSFDRKLFSTTPPGTLPSKSARARCCYKGCVFPAQTAGRGECAHHLLQWLEPDCFQSQQPSLLLLDQARFGLPDSEPDDERLRDRHRLAEQRVQFMLDDEA